MASPMDFASCAALLKTDVLPGSRGSVCSPHRSVKGVTTHIIPYEVYYVLQRIPRDTSEPRAHLGRFRQKSRAFDGRNLLSPTAPCRRFLFQRAAASAAAQINKPFGAKQ